MEIGPIPGIRAVQAVKSRPVDPELSPLFDVESSARAGDDTYTGSNRKAAGAEENEDDEDGEELEEQESAPAREGHHDDGVSPISFFA